MEPGREDRRDADEAEGDEGRAGADETVQRMGGIDRREQGRGARRRDDAGDVEPAPRRFGGQRRLSPPQDLAGRDEAEREGEAEQDARTGADQSRLDRIAHQEDAAEPEREPADPHRPACAELLLEAFLARRRGQGRRGQIRDEFGLDLGFGLRVRRAASRGRLELSRGPASAGRAGAIVPGEGSGSAALERADTPEARASTLASSDLTRAFRLRTITKALITIAGRPMTAARPSRMKEMSSMVPSGPV